MIRFTVWKSEDQYNGFRCEGHAGFANAGSDIVCSAVSALTFNTVNSIEKFTDDAFQVEAGKDGGMLTVKFPDKLSEKAVLLIDSLILGIESIEADYGNEYITLTSEEV